MWKRFSRRANWLCARSSVVRWGAHRSVRNLRTARDLLRPGGVQGALAAACETMRHRLKQTGALNAGVL